MMTARSREAGRQHDDLTSQIVQLELEKTALEKTNSRLRAEVQKFRRLVYVDALTGLGNRRHFERTIEKELRRATRENSALSLFLCDVDNFKIHNDTQGHPVGDMVLLSVASVLRQICQRGSDFAARFGGDEFALLMPGVPSGAAEQVADRLCAGVRELRIERLRNPVSLSCGVATYEGVGRCTTARLIESADRALYRAKRIGCHRAGADGVRVDSR